MNIGIYQQEFGEISEIIKQAYLEDTLEARNKLLDRATKELQ
jgi:hypothetical protein